MKHYTKNPPIAFCTKISVQAGEYTISQHETTCPRCKSKIQDEEFAETRSRRRGEEEEESSRRSSYSAPSTDYGSSPSYDYGSSGGSDSGFSGGGGDSGGGGSTGSMD